MQVTATLRWSKLWALVELTHDVSPRLGAVFTTTHPVTSVFEIDRRLWHYLADMGRQRPPPIDTIRGPGMSPAAAGCVIPTIPASKASAVSAARISLMCFFMVYLSAPPV